MYSAPVELKVIKAKHLKGFVWNARISRSSKVYPAIANLYGYYETVPRPTAYLAQEICGDPPRPTAYLTQEICGDPPFVLHFCGTHGLNERLCPIHADCFDRALEEAEKRIPYYAFLFGAENEKRHYKTQARLSPSQRS